MDDPLSSALVYLLIFDMFVGAIISVSVVNSATLTAEAESLMPSYHSSGSVWDIIPLGWNMIVGTFGVISHVTQITTSGSFANGMLVFAVINMTLILGLIMQIILFIHPFKQAQKSLGKGRK